MATFAEVKARVKTLLEAVSGIGLVHTHLPFVKDEKTEAEALKKDGRMHVWLITSGSPALVDENVNQQPFEIGREVVIHGFYSIVEPGSEDEFDVLCEAVLIALEKDRRPANAGGTKLAGTVVVADTPKMGRPDHREFGPSAVLCHHAEIVLPVTRAYTA